MLTIASRYSNGKTCDGISRRDFLKVGGLCVGGLTLADLLRLQAQGNAARRDNAVIMIYLEGGPSHLDIYDLKPEAPSDFRFEYKPIRTKVPGFDVCELLPLHAQIADSLAIVRNMAFGDSTHRGPIELETGFPRSDRPGFGSVVSRLDHDAGRHHALPPYVSLHTHAYPSYLGSTHRPFVPGRDSQSLALTKSVTLETLNERQKLLQTFDGMNRALDASQGELAAKDAFTAQALAMITSGKARDAFDVTKEPEAVRLRYRNATQLLQARRLVEAGVKVVSLSYHGVTPEERKRCRFCAGPWDTHGDTPTCLGLLLPRLDEALHALVTDLRQRGLDRHVAVVVWGEFGRTPKIMNELKRPTPGRNHWPDAGFALFAGGGGLKMGQVVGATDPRGAYPVGRPYRPRNVLATLYRVLGIDPTSTLPDHAGRPIYLLDDPEPIKELI